MKNKDIQEKRMKEYFIQAAKGIIKGEGIKLLSVRKIADQAGYSYATLYNYFKDANDLIFLCVSDFQGECKAFVEEQSKKNPEGLDRLKATVLAYMNFFVEYPGIFDLFYLTKVGEFGHKQTTMNVINNSLDSLCEAEWNYCINHNLLPIEKVESIKSQLKYTTIGLLLLYMNRAIPASYSEFIHIANTQVSDILGLKTVDNGAKIINHSTSTVQNSIISLKIG